MTFLNLPAELRVHVYTLLIPDSFQIRWYCSSLYTRTLSIPENVLLVNKQIYAEFVETFFRFQQVDIWTPSLALHDARRSPINLSLLEVRNIQNLRLSFDIRNATRHPAYGERTLLDGVNTVKATVQGVYKGARSLAFLKKLVIELRVREPAFRVAEFPDYFGILMDHKVSDRQYRDRWYNCTNTDVFTEIPREDGRSISVLIKLLEFT